MLLLGALSLTAPATDYFVCSDLGDDLAPGTSSAAPWRTVGRVNQMMFRGGDRIFFNGGHVFDDAGLRLTARMAGGDAGAQIVIGSYGGRPAVLRPPQHQNGIQLRNVGGITVQNVIIEGPGRQASDTDQRDLVMVRSGIRVYSTQVEGASLRGVTIAGVRISGFFTGIMIGAAESASIGYQDILIAGCTIFGNVHSGIELYGLFKPEHPRAVPSGGMDYPKPITDVLITGCELSAHQGTALWTFPKASGCGIILSGVDGAVIDRCTVHDNGGIGAKKKADSYGIWTYNAERVTVQRCLVRNQARWSGSENRADGISFGGGTARSIVRQSSVHNCQSSAFSVFQWQKSGGSCHDNAFIFNVSAGNGSGDAPSLVFADSDTKSTSAIGNLDVSVRGSSAICDQSLGSSNAFCNNILLIPGDGTVPDRRFFKAQSHQLGTILVRGNVYWSASGASPGGWQWGDRFYRTLDELRRCPVSVFMGNPPETRGGIATGMQVDPGLKLARADGAPTTVAGMLDATWYRPAADAPWLSAGVDLESIPGLDGVPRLRNFLNAKRDPERRGIPGPFGSGLKAPVIVSPPVAMGVVGQPFTYAIRAEPAPRIFRARGLPPNWSLNERTGVISGLPQQPLTARIILSVGLEDLPELDDELHLVLIIEPSQGSASGRDPIPAKPF